MRLTALLLLLSLYVLVIGQNWAWYAAALMLTAYLRNHGRLNSIPFSIG